MKQSNDEKGFTLVEVLVYTAILAIIAGLMTGILLTVVQVHQRESSVNEVTSQLSFALQTIQRLVRESSGIEINVGVTTSTLKLRMRDTAKDPTCISLVSSTIKLAEGPGTNPNNCTANTSDLTSSRVVVNDLTFKKFTQYPGHDSVSINLTITSNVQDPKGLVQRTLQTGIARVSAATFDSDVVPGSTYNFNLGQTGAPWQNLYLSGILKVGTAASDPTGQNGAIYYNTANNIFRGYSNGSWSNLGGSQWTTSSTAIYYNTGNVGIGTTDPTSPLYVKKDGLDHFGDGSVMGVVQIQNTAGTKGVSIGYNNSEQLGTFLAYGGSGGFSWTTHNGTSWGERMRISTTGNVGIGTTVATYNLTLAEGATIGGPLSTSGTPGSLTIRASDSTTGTNNEGADLLLGSGLGTGNGPSFMTFSTAAAGGTATTRQTLTERMRIDISGNVGIGTTGPGVPLDVNGAIRSRLGAFQLNDGTTTGGGLYFYKTITGSGSDLSPTLFAETGKALYFMTNGSVTVRMKIDTDGTFTGSAVNDISDARLKENVTTVESALDKIMQIRGVRFNWKEEANMTDRSQFGVLAQEVETVFPELVLDSSIFGGGYKSVQYGGFVAPFVEAIKELNSKTVKFDSSGNVGIGTTNPTVALEVNGNIKASGGSTNAAVCWKSGNQLGYCSSVVGADGTCTCN